MKLLVDPADINTTSIQPRLNGQFLAGILRVISSFERSKRVNQL